MSERARSGAKAPPVEAAGRAGLGGRPFAERRPEDAHGAPGGPAFHFADALGGDAAGPPPRLAPPGGPAEQAADRAAGLAAHGAPAPAGPAPSGGGAELPPGVWSAIDTARGRGQPLPGELRGAMEDALGADLGGVRLHADDRADGLSRALGAAAFTSGRDIFFRRSAYDAASAPGRALLAHELAHVAQQAALPEGAAPVVQAKLMWNIGSLHQQVGMQGARSEFFADIAESLALYEELQQPPGPDEGRTPWAEYVALQTLRGACQNWMETHQGTRDLQDAYDTVKKLLEAVDAELETGIVRPPEENGKEEVDEPRPGPPPVLKAAQGLDGPPMLPERFGLEMGEPRPARRPREQPLAPPPTVARPKLMSAAELSASTRLRGAKLGRTGRSGEILAEFQIDLLRYKTLKAASPGKQIGFLRSFAKRITAWLDSPSGKRSSRRPTALRLLAQVEDEAGWLSEQIAPRGEFSDAFVTAARDKAYGASMSTLDELTYGFGLDGDMKVPGSTTMLFKPDIEKNPNATEKERQKRLAAFKDSRGSSSGIAAADQRITERNLAFYAIDRLLAADLVPATYKAKHNRGDQQLEGVVMRKVEGRDGRSLIKSRWESDSAEELEKKRIREDPTVRRGLANLHLLDIICAQVDRHPGNYLIEMQGGTIVGVRAIDNDLSFGKNYTDLEWNDKGWEQLKDNGNVNMAWHLAISAGPSIYHLKEIDRTFAEKIIDLAERREIDVRLALLALLTPEEIDATVSRLKALAGFLKPLLQNGDGRIVTEWKRKG